MARKLDNPFVARIIGKKWISSSIIRLMFGGDGLAEFKSLGIADEWIRFVFRIGHTYTTRPYTVRYWDAQTLQMTVDIIMHDGGTAADWASSALIGSLIEFTGPEGRYQPPDGVSWVLLLADITGLPAAGRIIETSPRSVVIHSHICLPDMRDMQRDLEHEHSSLITWHSDTHGGPAAAPLSQIAKNVVLPEGEGYIWITGEANQVADARAHFRDEKGFDKNRITAIGYWFEGRPRE
ncbi:SIP domain-containing protein [Brucella pituitosa]|uniref:siderophore-interacting protein n=1 Tax=Brucella pituitosa TaxID=571256 RepID=UPI0020033F22|nr:SIP domain-containing protein [Brucella pituitosa]MCK4205053.1 SIP domain-containing protein [Brucella pituitosa]